MTIPVKPVTSLPSAGGLTLEKLAEAMSIPLCELKSWGCTDWPRHSTPSVRIAYRDQRGIEGSARYQSSLHEQHLDWKGESKMILYGLDRLEANKRAGWVLLVQGESDCWTGWHYDLPVLGIPAKSAWTSEWARLLEGVDVFIWEGPRDDDLTSRVARNIKGLRVVRAPNDIQDITAAHLNGVQVGTWLRSLKTEAILAADVLSNHRSEAADAAKNRCYSMLSHEAPLQLVEDAIRELGYGGDIAPAMLLYLACTSRLLNLQHGAFPCHLGIIGSPSSGKSFTTKVVKQLLPSVAFYEIDAGSNYVLIYDTESLEHRVVFFGESDSIPGGEDSPAASAIRNLLQDNRLHYKVVGKDPTTGEMGVRSVEKDGPTVLVTTAVRGFGEQLSSRLLCVNMRDDLEQTRQALQAQAEMELRGPQQPPEELLAFQEYLQFRAPWSVVVPFVDTLVAELQKSPAMFGINREFNRLLALIKSVAVLHSAHRNSDKSGCLMAQVADYEVVYGLMRDRYGENSKHCDYKVRQIVQLVDKLLSEKKPQKVSQALLARLLEVDKPQMGRRIERAIEGGWLVNRSSTVGRFDLVVGDELPPEFGLPAPDRIRKLLKSKLDEPSVTSDPCRAQLTMMPEHDPQGPADCEEGATSARVDQSEAA
jgi:hypothetical protein